MKELEYDSSLDRCRVGELKLFIDRFRRFQQTPKATFGAVPEFLQRFKVESPHLKLCEVEWKKKEAPFFNVFRMLRIERDETRLHSRFIAHLLDPYGSHGQQYLFLKEFLKILSIAGFSHSISDVVERRWEIKTEEQITGESRADISIRSDHFTALIENKVDAQEGVQQLERYSQWLQKQKVKDPSMVTCLVLLDPNGSLSELSAQPDVHLSYSEHIQKWLESCLPEVPDSHLKSALNHYLEIIKNF